LDKQGKLPTEDEAPHPHLTVTAPDSSGTSTVTLEMWGEVVMTTSWGGTDAEWPGVWGRINGEIDRRLRERGFSP
jgi:hypothetical protein